jgi:lipopolysaccharide export system protein LptA
MGFTVKKLQVAMLVSAGLLVAVTLAFVGYAKYLTHKFRVSLPARLGIDIQQQANGFTYSQSVQGKTVYTIHAAKAIQHNNGRWTLHDVGITLYGRNQDRSDHIYGSEFEYDQKAGEIEAAGDVQLDLSASPTAARVNSGREEDHVVHIKTSGLSYQEKTHRALTTARLDFTVGGYTGHALGADYNSETGLIVLGSDVVVSGLMQDKPATLNAAHAELNQQENVIDLISARYVAVPEDGGTETMTARHAVIHTDEDNNPEHIEAEGNVTLSQPDRGTLIADRGDAVLKDGRTQSTHLAGNLRYTDDRPDREIFSQANAEDARMAFDALGRISRIVVTGNVAAHERSPGSLRELHAPTVELAFTATGRQRAILHEAQATGGARLHLVEAVAKPHPNDQPNTTSDLSGDTLIAHFDDVSGVARLASVHGAGHTVVHRIDEQGADESSTGALLDAAFGPQLAVPAARPGTAVQLLRADQHGGVTLLRTTQPKPGTLAAVQHGSGDEAVYDAADDRVTLTGSAQLSDATSAVWAHSIALLRVRGDAIAEGGVRTTYLQASASSNPAEPVHVLADRALLHRDVGTAIFYGKQARLWQSGTQVEAPVLEFDRNRRTLFAHDDVKSGEAPVHTVLVSEPNPTGLAHPRAKQSPIRVASHEMLYTDLTRQVEFRGAVRVDDADGTMHADLATIFLVPTASKAQTDAIPGGQIDHIVATGAIALQQPGRIATGTQIVYTASDGVFVLTGSKADPPKVVDDAQGTITGESLRFKTGDDSILVTGAGAGHRVHTETHMNRSR